MRLADGTGATGESPTVQIRRERENYGADLDLYWWNGTTFVNTVQKLAMTEWDSTNHPGWYEYDFEQSLIELNRTYLVYFENTGTPQGSTVETHIFTNELVISAAEPNPLTEVSDAILDELEQMKDGGTGDFDPSTDSLHALGESAIRLAGLSRENSIYDQIVVDEYDQPKFGRLRVFDSAANVPSTPDGYETTGLLHEYVIEATYAGRNLLTSFVLKRVL
jgi:hypothetical protein